LGGIERFGIELVRSIDHTRVEPLLCGLWRFGTPYEEAHVERLSGEGIHAFFAADWDEEHPYRSFLEAWRGMRHQLSGQTVHLIHSHCQFGDGLALLLAHQLRAQALVRTVHNEREWPKRPERRLFLTNLLYPLLFRQEMGVSWQVVGNLDARPMARLLRRRGLCMYNAVNLERFSSPQGENVRQDKRRELGIPAQAPVIGTIGRLTVQKGYSVLLQAVDSVLRVLPDAHFVIVGDGELGEDLVSMAARLGIADAVHFAGARNDVEQLLATMDLFVSSSLWEGLPTVILESMASGVPVVATDVSGTRELVSDGVTGLLVPAGDASLLAQAIVRALRDRDHTHALVERAYGRVRDFSIQRVAQQHVEAYSALLSAE
jgi:glycosyltransferase involved in cell wall biosynthesis